MRLWTLSAKEIDRVEIIQMVIAKRMTVTKAAERVGVRRQRMSHLVNAYRRDGAVALVSRKRNKPANNCFQKLCAYAAVRWCVSIMRILDQHWLLSI